MGPTLLMGVLIGLQGINPDDFEIRPELANSLDQKSTEVLDNWYKKIARSLPPIPTPIRPTGAVLDIGANVGAFTAAVTKKYPMSKVFCFEPVPIYAQYIKKRHGDATVFNVAASNSSGLLTLYVTNPKRHDNLGSNTIHPSKRRSYHDEKVVRMSAVDDFANALPVIIDLIKIDVEGAEYLVLEGIIGLLNRAMRSANCLPTILVELGWGVENPQWPRVDMQIKRLFSIGYERTEYRTRGTHDVVLRPSKESNFIHCANIQ